MVCPKCKRRCKRLLALSRFSNDMICSPCGNKEAFEHLLKIGMITKRDYDEKCAEIDKLWEGKEE